MTTTIAAPFPWGGSPFESESERLLWEAGYCQDFDTQAEADAAIAELRNLPQFSRCGFRTRVI
jgi:hypothetical protein